MHQKAPNSTTSLSNDLLGSCSVQFASTITVIIKYMNNKWLKHTRIDGNKLKAKDIGSLALNGDPLTIKAVNVMMGALGTAVANGVLTTGSFQGVIICGGIIPNLLDLFYKSPFCLVHPPRALITIYCM